MRLQTRWNVTRSSVAMSGFGPASARSFNSGPASKGSEAWRQNLITDPHNIAKVMSDDIWPLKPGDQHLPCCSQIAGQAKSVAVMGIKTKDKASQPAYFVPEALARRGVDVIPVPVYYPEVQEILGKQVYRSLREIPADHHPLDIVDVFRRSSEVLAGKLGSSQQLSDASLTNLSTIQMI